MGDTQSDSSSDTITRRRLVLRGAELTEDSDTESLLLEDESEDSDSSEDDRLRRFAFGFAAGLTTGFAAGLAAGLATGLATGLVESFSIDFALAFGATTESSDNSARRLGLNEVVDNIRLTGRPSLLSLSPLSSLLMTISSLRVCIAWRAAVRVGRCAASGSSTGTSRAPAPEVTAEMEDAWTLWRARMSASVI